MSAQPAYTDHETGEVLSLDTARADQQALAERETVIERGLATFIEVGMALMNIRDRRLYRLHYRTFEEYCRIRWTMSTRRAYQFIDAANVAQTLCTNGSQIPALTNERQARALAAFDEDLRPAILRTAQARYGDLSESKIVRVGEVIQMMAQTGTVDIGDGSNTPIDAALAKEDEEAVKRQKEYIHNRGKLPEPLFDQTGAGLHVLARLQQLWRVIEGKQVRVIVREITDAHQTTLPRQAQAAPPASQGGSQDSTEQM